MQPFEYYLHRGKIFDKAIFSSLSFEDDFGMGKRLNALEFWTSEIERINSGITITNNSAVIKGAYEEYIESGMLEKSIFHKAVYWLRKDKAFFIRRLREYVSGNR